MNIFSVVNLVLTILQVLNFYSTFLYAINCFDCVSYNHNNPDCEDPFYRSRNIQLKKDCVTGLPEKNGSFRATHCLKLVANGHGVDYVIRTCSLDTGSGRLDKEIVRVSHCGYLSLENFHGLEENSEAKKTISANASNQTTTAKRQQHRQHKKHLLFKGCLSVCQQDECNGSTMTTSNTSRKHFMTFIYFFAVHLIFIAMFVI